MRKRCYLSALFALAVGVAPAVSAQAPPLSALAKMPVKEITVFKDGHAFVVHEGKMPTDAAGNVQLDYLPTPVIGTFWPYSSDNAARLSAVTASPRRVQVERTALTLFELLDSNPGVEVGITDTDGKGFGAQIVGVPTRTSEELETTEPPGSGDKLPMKASIILLKMAEGIAVLPIDRIKTAVFIGQMKRKVVSEEFRNLLTLKLEWQGNRPAKTADVGMMYLQKGVRWIPGYKVAIDGKGNAVIKLQATLLNEMTDLNDVTANLVVGVPSFFFKDTPDPISLQQAFGQLSQYFQTDARSGFAMSNAMMTQVARAGERGGFAGGAPPQQPPNLGPEVAGSEKSEDLFVYTVKHVTLKKGQRMVLPIAEFPLKYKDLYTLDLPFAPPPQLRANVSTEQQAQLARLFYAPKVEHKLRFNNQSKFPLTTAPALITQGDRVLAQGMMTYTAIGAETDLALTQAVDVKVKKSEKEAGRVPNVVVWQGNRYQRIDMTGTLTLTNYDKEAVELEVTRHVLGLADKADHNGKAEMINLFEDNSYMAPSDNRPYWWSWYGWPGYWHHLNGVGRFTWKLKLDPGKSVDLGYTWHYFWE